MVNNLFIFLIVTNLNYGQIVSHVLYPHKRCPYSRWYTMPIYNIENRVFK